MQVYFNRGQPDPKISAVPGVLPQNVAFCLDDFQIWRGQGDGAAELWGGEKMLREILETSPTHHLD